jgi:hypothetical protein
MIARRQRHIERASPVRPDGTDPLYPTPADVQPSRADHRIQRSRNDRAHPVTTDLPVALCMTQESGAFREWELSPNRRRSGTHRGHHGPPIETLRLCVSRCCPNSMKQCPRILHVGQIQILEFTESAPCVSRRQQTVPRSDMYDSFPQFAAQDECSIDHRESATHHEDILVSRQPFKRSR